MVKILRSASATEQASHSHLSLTRHQDGQAIKLSAAQQDSRSIPVMIGPKTIKLQLHQANIIMPSTSRHRALLLDRLPTPFAVRQAYFVPSRLWMPATQCGHATRRHATRDQDPL